MSRDCKYLLINFVLMFAADEDEGASVPELVMVDTQNAKKVPVTIITGLLGSGKTTFLNYILNSSDIKNVAVIQNEYGSSIELEKSVILNSNASVSEWLEFPNGCICCTVKDGLVLALENLIEKRANLNHIIIETSGLADPGPLAKMLWVDDGLESNVYLDSIVTFVDVKNVMNHLDPQLYSDKTGAFKVEAFNQIAVADIIVLNKLDLLQNENQLETIKSRIKQINNYATLHETQMSVIGKEKIFGINSFDKLLVLNYLQSKDFNLANTHDSGCNEVVSVLVSCRGSAKSKEEIELLIAKLFWEDELKIYRMKGQVSILNDGNKYIIQGVYDSFEVVRTEVVWDVGERENKLMLIGRELNVDCIEAQFKKLLEN